MNAYFEQACNNIKDHIFEFRDHIHPIDRKA